MRHKVVQKRLIFAFHFFAVVLFACSLYLFAKHSQQYTLAYNNHGMTEQHYNRLLQKKSRLEQIKRYAAQATKVNNALKTLGYTPENWSEYKVGLNKGMGFAELSNTLGQAQHGRDYFFIPKSLEVTLPEKASQNVPKGVEAHLNLQGFYLVKK